MNKGNDGGFGSAPIRSYKAPNQPNLLRTILVLLMTAVIIAFVVIFIMSITGTGLFADKKEEGGPTINPPTSTTDGGNTTTGTPTTTPPETDDPDEVKLTYLTKDRSGLQYGFLQLINEEHPYGFKEESLLDDLYTNRPNYKSYQISKSTHKLKYEAIKALNQMMDDFYTVTGYTYLNINKAYYDFDSQKSLYEQGITDTPPGASDWHSGATFRFTGYNPDAKKTVNITTAAEPQWLKEHAHEYGFIFRAPSNKQSHVGYVEPWQLRYVGMPHAEYMYKNKLCLEEYLTELATEHVGVTYSYTLESIDGNTYQVYYVEAPEEGQVRVPVPENRPYTISGDNVNGYIVTVTLEKGTRQPLVTSAPETSAPDTTEAE